MLIAAAKYDKDAIAAGEQDPRSFDFAAKAFGNTGRLEYDAELKIRGEMDESEKKFKEDLKTVGIGVAEIAGEPELPGMWTLAWRAGSFAVKEFGGGAYVESGPDMSSPARTGSRASTTRTSRWSSRPATPWRRR